jgi:predicted naringenin-chalcone synthase
MSVAYVNRIGTAVPDHDVHRTFIGFVELSLADPRSRRLFARMAERAGIEHRYSCLRPGTRLDEAADDCGFYRRGRFPGTGARMERFAACAPDLMRRAVAALDLGPGAERISHLVLASCTGFTAPGLDQRLMAALGLDPSIERTVVGFMGCAAAVNALKVAHHIVRSEPEARVLVVNVELCTLHMQDDSDLGKALTALLFGDGCTAALVTGEPAGLALRGFRAATIPDTADLITWTIGDQGFDMSLSGEVPGRIARALRREAGRNDGIFREARPDEIDLWAVHAGGRTILDAVEEGLGLDGKALHWSRGVLRAFGNMSSCTLMFVLERMLREAGGPARGFAMAFGPGLVAETFRFETVA